MARAGLSAPARRALINAKLHKLEDLATVSGSELNPFMEWDHPPQGTCPGDGGQRGLVQEIDPGHSDKIVCWRPADDHTLVRPFEKLSPIDPRLARLGTGSMAQAITDSTVVGWVLADLART